MKSDKVKLTMSLFESLHREDAEEEVAGVSKPLLVVLTNQFLFSLPG